MLTGYHEKLVEITRDLVEHGWGDFSGHIESLKDNKVRVELFCGKSYVFFVSKNIEIDESKLL
jgi:hypothetical protein